MASGAAQRERILEAATVLFAEHGFDGVSTRQIGKAVGLNIATVSYHVGGKRELYRQVVQRLHEQERTAIEVFLGELDETAYADSRRYAATVDTLIDGVVDLVASQSTRARIYMRRWLELANDMSSAETEHSMALHRRLAAFLARGQEAGLVNPGCDLDLFLRSFTWQLYGHAVTGPFHRERLYGDPTSEEAVARFKEFLRDFARRMLGLEPT
jgi:AcrR family transcriptional regulator